MEVWKILMLIITVLWTARIVKAYKKDVHMISISFPEMWFWLIYSIYSLGMLIHHILSITGTSWLEYKI